MAENGFYITAYQVGLFEDQASARDDMPREAAFSSVNSIAIDPDAIKISQKDMRILTREDLLALETARIALAKSATESVEHSGDLGCVVFTTGKGTVKTETEEPRSHYRGEDGRADFPQLLQAIDDGETLVDPFAMLRELDNNLLWWFCKSFAVQGFNLQLNQVAAPACTALVEALGGLEDGLCERVLVGGSSIIEREEVIAHARGESAIVPEQSYAVFLVIEASSQPPAHAIAKIAVSAGRESDQEQETIAVEMIDASRSDACAYLISLIEQLEGPSTGKTFIMGGHQNMTIKFDRVF